MTEDQHWRGGGQPRNPLLALTTLLIKNISKAASRGSLLDKNQFGGAVFGGWDTDLKEGEASQCRGAGVDLRDRV
jgi:hypothetical protein